MRKPPFLLNRSLLLAVAATAVPGGALADDFLDGVYASRRSACEQLATTPMGQIEDQDFLVLTVNGVRGYEYSCDFADVKPTHGFFQGWLVSAICEYPGETFPELISITRMAEDTLQVTFMTENILAQAGVPGVEEDAEADSGAGDDGTEALPGSYFLCAGVDLTNIEGP